MLTAKSKHANSIQPQLLEMWRWHQATHPAASVPSGLSLEQYLTASGGRFAVAPQPFEAYARILTELPFENSVEKQIGVRRVLMLLPWLEMGGADKFNLDVIDQLSQHNFEFSICTTLPSGNAWRAEFARLTPDVFCLPDFLNPLDFPRFLLYLIHSRQVDIVFISNSYLGYQLLPFLRAHCPQVTFVDYCHMEEPWRNGNYPRAGVGYQELLDLNIVSTQYLKQWMIERKADANRVEVCYTNINTDQWQTSDALREQTRTDLGIPVGKPVLLYAGRIVPQKRPRLFVEVIRRLVHDEHLQFECIVAGDGEDLPELKRRARRYKLGKFLRFVGPVTLEQMKSLQAAADIFFLPSEHEGLSLALFEAMAMETVPVAADVAGQKELVTPACGYLVSQGKGEIEAYVAALKILVNTPEIRREMAKMCRARIINRFTHNQLAQRLNELLDRAQDLTELEPRPAVGQGLGLECATKAISHTPLYQLTQIIDGLPGDDLARWMSWSKLSKVVGFKLTHYPTLHWLHRFRQYGKRVLKR